jgi:probable HAF family extracellular repeat protein
MKSIRLLSIIAMTVFAGLAIPVRLATQARNQQPPNYTVTDLGTLGGTVGIANAVNNSGSVVGEADLPGDTERHAFLWSKGIKSDLGTFGGPNSFARFINERGEVVGLAETSAPDPLGEDFCGDGSNLTCLPFLWQDGLMVSLPTLGGYNGFANGINSRGQVAGAVENTTPDPTCSSPPVPLELRPVIWEKGAIQQELTTIGGDPDGLVQAINDNGQAIGQTYDCINSAHAVLWNEGTPIDLGTPGGLLLIPLGINNRGQIVGFEVSSDGTVLLAFLWQNGVATELGTLPPDVFSLAIGINDKGQIVGDSCDMDFSCRAFLWEDGTMTDLNGLVRDPNAPFLENGNSINSRGQIAGKTTVQGTDLADAYLATPSPGEAMGENAVPAVATKTSPRSRVVSPEDVRRALRQRLGSRFHIPGFGAPHN